MNASGDNRIVVDWDDTLVKGAWPEQGDWLPGAREALRAFLAAGYEVVVFSTRLSGYEIDERTPRRPGAQAAEILRVRRMLDDAGLRDVDVWNLPWKPGAVAYIDDKGVRFDGDWQEILERFKAAA